MASQPSYLLADLLDTSSMRLLYGSSSCPVQQVVADSRHVVPGALFVAVRGHSMDGHEFLGDVLDQGAAALVVEVLPPALQSRVEREGQAVVQVANSRQALAAIASGYYGHASRQLPLVGVTGTNGKTTITYVVESILQAAGLSVGVMGTVENRFAGERVAATQTTPDALQVQSLLRQMQDRGVEAAVMEVTSHALDQDRVAGCEFRVCMFTNLTRDHYDYHGSEAAYFAAKARLFTELSGDWHVLNLDDPYGRKLLDISPSRVLTYGIDSDATLAPRQMVHGLDGIRFTLPTTKGTLDIQSPLVGRHNVYNLLAGIAVGLAMDLDADAIVRGIEQLTQVPGRLDRVDEGQDFYVFVDYAHTPDALEQVLRAVRAETPGRLITVFGCGGDRDPGKRPLMGQAAVALSDYTVITSDNPRTESPEAIVAEIVAGAETSRHHTAIVDRRAAIVHAIAEAKPKDTVIIAGKGHETYQIVGQTRRHFDDREVAREALHQRGRNLMSSRSISPWTVADVLRHTGGTLLQGDAQQRFRSVSTDSRQIEPGEMFVALRGDQFDGHAFIEAAAQRGAAVALVSEDGEHAGAELTVVAVPDTLAALQALACAQRQRFAGTVVGITGSNGKTTVKELTAAVLQQRYDTFRSPGNLNNHIGLPLSLLRLPPTAEVCVCEMGMNHLGEIRDLCSIAQPHVGVVTNVALAHLGYLGSLDKVRQAKGEMIEALDADGIAVVNADDPRTRALGERAPGRVISFGVCREARVRGRVCADLGLDGLQCELDIDGGIWPFQLALPGQHNLSNALAAAAVGVALQVPAAQIVSGLQAYRGMYGRMAIRHLHDDIVMIDDSYNANPDSVRAALRFLKQVRDRARRLVVMGDMRELGEAAPALHREMGTLAQQSGVDELVVLGEFAGMMSEGAREAGMAPSHIHCVTSHQKAVTVLERLLGSRDIVLVKGSRGMTMERVVKAMITTAENT